MNAPAAMKPLPYGRQSIDDDDVAAVVAALRAEYLTTGPLVAQFEAALCAQTGAQHAVAVSNGTAALHLAARAAGLAEGTWTIVPSNTFLATANAVRLNGGEVIFADVDPESGLMTPETLAEALRETANKDVRAAIPVHYAGPNADMAGLAHVAAARGLTLIEDAAHAIGSFDRDGAATGSCAHSRMTCFSFHPVKTMTTGEGGAVTTNDAALAKSLRADRNHGMTRDSEAFQNHDMARARDGGVNPWYYEMPAPGLNYRICDVQCALGLSQLAKLSRFVAARADLKAAYDDVLRPLAPHVRTPECCPSERPAWHLYPVGIDFLELKRDRADVMRALTASGVATQVHYIPVHLQPYYRARYGRRRLPGAERRYSTTLSLPLFPDMTQPDVHAVANALRRALGL